MTDDDFLKSLVGQTEKQAHAEALLRDLKFRSLKENSTMTCEIRNDRVNVYTDNDGIVTSARIF